MSEESSPILTDVVLGDSAVAEAIDNKPSECNLRVFKATSIEVDTPSTNTFLSLRRKVKPETVALEAQEGKDSESTDGDLEEAIEETIEDVVDVIKIGVGFEELDIDENIEKTKKEILKDWFGIKKGNFKEGVKNKFKEIKEEFKDAPLETLVKYTMDFAIGATLLIAFSIIGLSVGAVLAPAIAWASPFLGAVPFLLPVLNMAMFVAVRSMGLIGKYARTPIGRGVVVGVVIASFFTGVPLWIGGFAGALGTALGKGAKLLKPRKKYDHSYGETGSGKPVKWPFAEDQNPLG